MAKGPVKLSGLLSAGKVVPKAARTDEVPEAPEEQPGSTPAAQPDTAGGQQSPAVVATPAPAPEAPQIASGTNESTTKRDAPAARALPAAEPSAPPVLIGGRDLRMIESHLIDQNRLAPRAIYTPAMISKMAESLRLHGQNDPIHVIPNPSHPGRFIIADGWTRVSADLEHHLLPALLAEVHHDLSERDAAWFGHDQNEDHNGETDYDKAQFYAACIQDGEAPADVARKAKVSKSLMTFYSAFAQLPDELAIIVRDYPEKFTATVGYHLFKLYDKCGVRKAYTLATRFAGEDQTQKWFIAQAQALANPTGRKTTPTSKHFRYRNGFFKQRGDTFELSIEVPQEKQDRFSEELEKLLETVAEPTPIEGSKEKAGTV